eukprot:scaffold271100_cov17-Tisochrysis_lutea.AAC.1
MDRIPAIAAEPADFHSSTCVMGHFIRVLTMVLSVLCAWRAVRRGHGNLLMQCGEGHAPLVCVEGSLWCMA